MNLRPIADDALLARLDVLVSEERASVADVIEHLAEVDRREVVVDRGYSTLFDYCVNKLRFSEAAALLRIRVARAAIRFPRILVDLRSGALHLDAVMRLHPHLSPVNCDDVLNKAAGATKREVLALAAQFGSTEKAPERDAIRYLPPKPSPQSDELEIFPTPASSNPPIDLPQTTATTATVLPPPSRVRLAFTADDEFLVMLEQARSLRRHKFPSGRMEEILKEALVVLLDKVDPSRRALRRRKRSPIAVVQSGGNPSRRIPAAVKAEVWKRDGGRCAYEAPDGRRCESRSFLEYDHILPWALGGQSDCVGNIRLLCRPHNQRLARRQFGPRR
jgi:5-methylcytosine-specific restriction endonuclease McrA